MKTYTRPMGAWWTRNPYYLWYMLREASCVFITVYALILLVGLFRLSQGKAPYERWLESLASPFSLLFHALALVLVLYHSWTWFKVMPKTLPFVRIGAWRVPDRAIVVSGVCAAVACTVLIVLLAATP
jgi:fumarate reductase subunit C